MAGVQQEKVKLEAAKKGRARVEVDVVLERECVVEGGEVRGRIEVKVGKKGVRVGMGKVRVVGYEGE
jgi:sporulation-control protein spo0M